MGHSLTLPCLVGCTERRRRPSVRWKVRQIPCFPSRLMELQNASRPLLSPAKPAHAHICQASEPARKWRGVSTTSAPVFHTVQACLRLFVHLTITIFSKHILIINHRITRTRLSARLAPGAKSPSGENRAVWSDHEVLVGSAPKPVCSKAVRLAAVSNRLQ